MIIRPFDQAIERKVVSLSVSDQKMCILFSDCCIKYDFFRK